MSRNGVQAVIVQVLMTDRRPPSATVRNRRDSRTGSISSRSSFVRGYRYSTSHRPESRRGSVASRNSDSYNRPYAGRTASQVDIQTPGSVFQLDSEDEDDDWPGMSSRARGSYHDYPASPTTVARRESRRKGKTPSSATMGYRDSEDYFSSRPAGDREALNGTTPGTSPTKPSTTIGKLVASFFPRNEGGDEEAGQRSRHGSRRPSVSSSRSGRSASPSSSEGWGYRDDDADTYSQVSDRPEGEEGYTSSLADDTSLPPQSRPGSPTLPLIPSGPDGIFGEPGHAEGFEPKDFDSTTVPSRQTVVLPDEDLSIRFTGYRTDPFRRTVWWIGCILTFGGLGLLGRWIPSIWVKFCGKETAFDEAKEGSWLMVEVGRQTDGFY